MFIKDFKIRSNNQIKSSEKKNLIKEVLKQYSQITEEELKSIINPKDSEIYFSKIITHDSIDIIVYFFDKIPYFFKIDKNDQLIPTVYFLWKFPSMLPKFYTHKEVFNKYLLNGADLMMPGLITPETVNLYTFKHIKKNDLVALCLAGNDAPVAIGKASLSGEDMYMSAMRGKCLNILQIYQDNLWSLGDKSIKIPNIPIQPVKTSSQDEIKNEQEPIETEQDELKSDEITKKFDDLKLQDDEKDLDNQKLKEEETKKSLDGEKLDHEKLLTECFLSAIKFKSKEFKLPIIVSTFMKTMQSCCPPGIQYDLKQTRFKKISMFLKEMELKGCIKTKELQKGVLSITEILKENENVKYFKKPEWMKEENQQTQSNDKKEDQSFVFEVNEVFKVDGNNEKFFKNQYRKGDIITSSEIRNSILNYIKENQLQSKDDPKLFQPDETLNKIFIPKSKQQDVISYVEFFNTLFEKLSPMHMIKRVYKDRKLTDDDTNIILRKGKFQAVEFRLESRGGNKKVTSVTNLHAFQLDPNYLQSKLRKEIGCSVNYNQVNESASALSSTALNDYIIEVQGNQIHAISEILKNEFGIPFKYMQGLELGVKN